MKGISSKICKTITIGTRLKVADNSGARIAQVIGVLGFKGVKGRIARAGVADIVICTIKEGEPDMKHSVQQCVIIRQRKEYRRHDGTRIKFEDNAAIVLKEKKGDPKGTRIKGPVAREVVERFTQIGKIASVVI